MTPTLDNRDTADAKKPPSRAFPWLAIAGCGLLTIFTCMCFGGVGTWFVYDRWRDTERKAENARNMKAIILAIHDFHDAKKMFPPAAIVDPDTQRPLLSWRVAILPYLKDEEELARTIRMNEPWDSDHNRTLWNRMPKVFQMPGQSSREWTYYQAFRSDVAIFRAKGTTKIAQVTDGTSNTILFVEATTDVNWMAPHDISFLMKHPDLMKQVGNHWGNDTFNAAFADGTLRRLKRSMPAHTLEALVTREGAEAVDSEPWEVR